MNEFMMIFRYAPDLSMQPTPEQMQEAIKQWQDWIGGIAAQGKFISTNQLSMNGKTLKPNNVITDGPYAELKEIIGGYILVQAGSIEEAMKLAVGCPVLFMGGHVEVRETVNMK